MVQAAFCPPPGPWWPGDPSCVRPSCVDSSVCALKRCFGSAAACLLSLRSRQEFALAGANAKRKNSQRLQYTATVVTRLARLHKLFRCTRHFPPAAPRSVAAALRAAVLLADERVAAVVAVVVPRRARARRAARLARRAPDAELLRWRGARSQPWLTQKAGRGRTVTSSSFSTPFTTVFCTLLGLRSNGRQ